MEIIMSNEGFLGMLPNEKRCMKCGKVKKLSQMRGEGKNVCKSCFNKDVKKRSDQGRKGRRRM